MLWKFIYKTQLNIYQEEYCLFTLILNNRDKFELNAFHTSLQHIFGIGINAYSHFFSFIYVPGHATRSCKVYNVFTKKSLGGFYLINLCLHLCQPVLQQQETFCFVCSCLAHWLIFDLHTAQLEISPIPI